MEDASIAPSVRAAVKFRSRCHRPSGKLDVMCSHCLSSPIRSACESRVRFILLVLAFSNVDSTANMFTTLPDESLCSNHTFPCIAFRARKCSQPASRAVRSRCCSISCLSWGARNATVSESPSMPRYLCIRVGLRSQFLSKKKISAHE